MKPFNLEEWLQNKSRKVVTRNNRPVRIVCWDKLGDFPIIGCIKYSDDYEDFESYNIDGSKYSCNREDQNDLFFADEEEKLTEFDSALMHFAHDSFDSLLDVTKGDALSRWRDKLLDLARKELQPEFDKELDKAYKTQDDVVYRSGYAQGKQDALKDLPKWKRMPNGIQGNGDFNPTYLVRVSNGYYFTTPCLSWDKDSMYIELSELENLPKEE